MKIHKYTVRELKLTAILYATRGDVVEHVTSTGKLPAKIPLGGFPTAMNILLRRRGSGFSTLRQRDVVFEAIEQDKLITGGRGYTWSRRGFPSIRSKLGNISRSASDHGIWNGKMSKPPKSQ